MFHSAKKAILTTFGFCLFGLTLIIGLMVTEAGTLSAVAPLYVDDDTCPAVGSGTNGDPYCTIQSAVDAAIDQDEIRVAGGIYTGTQKVTALDGKDYTQVVIIDRKSITVTGGYSSADWAADPDPESNPTIIDAERTGRGLTILGQSNDIMTVEGLTITGGDYTGLGNPSGQGNQGCLGTGYDCGGGVRVEGPRLIMRHVLVYDNIAARVDQSRPTQGGGMDARQLQPGSLIANSQFISNTAGGDRGYGGGLNVSYSEVLIQDCLFEDNYATRDGGGLDILLASPVRLMGTSFKNNTAASNGGAILAEQGFCSLKENSLEIGGGTLTGNQAYAGSAMYLNHSNSWGADCGATLTNLILAENRSTGSGISQAVINVGSYKNVYPLILNHITAANNDSPTFLYLASDSNSQAITVTVNNTLVTSTTYGIAAEETAGEITINVNHPLMHDVDNPFYVLAGTPAYNLANPVTGDPKLDGTYHLGWGSAAIEAGIDAGVLYDIDGDERSVLSPDIGADEWRAFVYLPMVVK